ncbi:hypothetical protein HMI54_008324, partial [Coelomomyces lativittatus]
MDRTFPGGNRFKINRPIQSVAQSCRYCDDPRHLRGECPKLRRHLQEGCIFISPRGTICWADSKEDMRGPNFFSQVENYLEEMTAREQNQPGTQNPPKTVRSIRWNPGSTEAGVNALATQERDVQMRDVGDRIVNPDMYTYREVSDRANDLLMEAFAAGTTEVPNSVFLNHPEIFKRHRLIQMKSKKREGGETGNFPNNGLNQVMDHLIPNRLANITPSPNQRENLTCAPCGYINVVINGTSVRALWDSGAEVNLMQEKTARSLGINVTEGPSNIRAFDGSLSSTKGGASSVLVDIGGVHGLLYFVIVDRANDEVILGRPFEMAFQTTSAVLGDGTYTGTVQNHDGTKKVSLSILKGNANRENVSGFGTHLTQSGKALNLPFARVNPEYENLQVVPLGRDNTGFGSENKLT